MRGSAVSANGKGANAMREEPKAKVSRWRMWRKAVIGALGGVGIYLAAIPTGR